VCALSWIEAQIQGKVKSKAASCRECELAQGREWLLLDMQQAQGCGGKEAVRRVLRKTVGIIEKGVGGERRKEKIC
jgi:hypothetical protein